MNKTKLPVYIPKEMYESIQEYVPRNRCEFIDDEFVINDVKINLIHTSHDAPSSVGFIIENNDKKLTYVTDTGYINRKYLNKMVNMDCYVIESNHDEIMLMDGPYPRFLKERVISDKGHLSNTRTAKYLKKIVGNKTKNIILAHRSETNNTEEKVMEAINSVELDKSINIYIARQLEESPLIEV